MAVWDYWLSRIGKEVAEEHKVSIHQVHEMYDAYWKGNGKAIRRNQQVLVPNFGVWRISPKRANRVLNSMFDRFNDGSISRQLLHKIVSNFMPMWLASKYHRPRKGQGYKKGFKRGYRLDYVKPYEKTSRGRKEAQAGTAPENQPIHGSNSAADQLQHVFDAGRPGHPPGPEGGEAQCPTGVQGFSAGQDVGGTENL